MTRNLSALFVLASLGLGGCGGGGNGNGAGNGNPATETDAGTAADAPIKKTVKPLDFTLSNIDEPDAPQDLAGDLVLSGKCEVDTDAGTIDCADDDRYEYVLMQQNDDDKSDIAVFLSENLTVQSGAEITITGSHPVLFLAFGEVKVNGTLRAIPGDFSPHTGLAGGFGSPSSGSTQGAGPGGGGPGTTGVGASGGSFCGLGGGTQPGAAYGNSALTPLIGGSSGGTGMNGHAGAGGGAIQIVARDGIEVTSTGVITAGGAGGQFGGGVASQPASGGGSGGAILLEAPTVRVAGKLAANGGGGGGAAINGESGQLAQPNGSAAIGGFPNGGDGSSEQTANGASGTSTGASGGAAGRIRINSSTGVADIASAQISPAAGTGCASEGMIQ